jgi:hypothetical protein
MLDDVTSLIREMGKAYVNARVLCLYLVLYAMKGIIAVRIARPLGRAFLSFSLLLLFFYYTWSMLAGLACLTAIVALPVPVVTSVMDSCRRPSGRAFALRSGIELVLLVPAWLVACLFVFGALWGAF